MKPVKEKAVPTYIEEAAAIPAKPGKVTHVAVEHEKGCPFLRGGMCTCRAQVREVKPS
jgi:hypothetical protein